jgi:acetolactate synthase-1/2/3 large subunit
MKLTGAQILCEGLIKEGVEVMFGLPGGAILPFYQVLPEYPQLRHILVRHEQAAGHAADGFARVSGKVGVCVATSGPGATNLVTALASAHMDSTPIVAITGQVPRGNMGKDAFQETDVTGITLPITKHNYLVMHTDELAQTIKEAFYIARTGRPGPVLIDIPKDVLTEHADFHYPDKLSLRGYQPTVTIQSTAINQAAKLINNAKKPVIVAGHGIIISGAYQELQEFAEKIQVPVATTLLGVSSFPENHSLSIGMLGMHGVAWASMAVDQCDLLIGIGMRFDDRVTGRIKDFATHAKIVHIDIDPAEIGKNVNPTVPILGDVKQVLQQLLQELKPTVHTEWLSHIDALRRNHPSLNIRETDGVLPQYVIHQISKATNGKAIIVTGVGQHQMWAAQHFCYREMNSWVSSGGLGAMGFEIPAAIGAAIARPDLPVWSVAGDGGFQMTMYEMATMMENNIPVKIAILNNNYLGMVRQLQDLFHKKTYVAVEYTHNPDFVALAKAYGIEAMQVSQRSQVDPAIKAAMNFPGPVLIDFLIEREENVYPHIPSGTSVKEMIEETPEEVTWPN